MEHTHRIRVQVPRFFQQRPTVEVCQRLVDKINSRAEGNAWFGCLDQPYDGKTRLKDVSHIVLPTARLRGDRILVDIDIVDTAPGRTLMAMFEAGVTVAGSLRAVGAGYEDLSISGLDVVFPPNVETTVLDEIVDALDDDD